MIAPVWTNMYSTICTVNLKLLLLHDIMLKIVLLNLMIAVLKSCLNFFGN